MAKGRKVFKFNKIWVRFGEPVYFDEYFKLEDIKETYQKIVDKVMDEIKKLNQ